MVVDEKARAAAHEAARAFWSGACRETSRKSERTGKSGKGRRETWRFGPFRGEVSAVSGLSAGVNRRGAPPIASRGGLPAIGGGASRRENHREAPANAGKRRMAPSNAFRRRTVRAWAPGSVGCWCLTPSSAAKRRRARRRGPRSPLAAPSGFPRPSSPLWPCGSTGPLCARGRAALPARVPPGHRAHGGGPVRDLPLVTRQSRRAGTREFG